MHTEGMISREGKHAALDRPLAGMCVPDQERQISVPILGVALMAARKK